MKESNMMRPALLFLFKFALSLASSALLAFSFPPSTTPFFIWIAFLPLFYAVFNSSLGVSILYSAAAGIFYHILTFLWVRRFHGLALPVLSGIFGILFFALPLILIKLFYRRTGALSLIFVPALWVSFEYIRSIWVLRFPFGILGYTQFSWLKVIQIADITGVWGLSFIIIFANIAAYFILENLLIKKISFFDKKVYLPLFIFCGLAISVFTYGIIRAATISYDENRSLRVGLAQTLLDPNKSWLEYKEKNLKDFSDLSEKLKVYEPDLIVFPETAVDTYLNLDGELSPPANAEILNHVSNMAKGLNSYILIGALELASNSPEMQIFNSAFLFDRDGDLTGIYRKRDLVPFAERDPLKNLFPPFHEKLLRETGALMLSRGPEPELLSVAGKNGKDFKFGTVICYESTFGSYSRDYVRGGADFLVIMTNDLWSLSKAGMYQHAMIAAFRAIENRVPIIRVSNGGISFFIDQNGRFFTKLPIFKSGTMITKLSISRNAGKTIYTMFGDWFAVTCAALVVIGLFFFVIRIRAYFPKSPK